jgi:hypothetical protein
MASSSSIALAGFRKLLRTSRAAFRNDIKAISAARVQLKLEFLKNKDVSDEVELRELYKGILEVDEMLRFNIAQGTRTDRGNYAVELTEENQVVVDAGQENPHGQEIAPVDRSIIGEVVVERRGKGKKIPFEPAV